MEKKFKLCYVDGNKAYFTDNFEKQWGDDWNDSPYEHNAGEPYTHYFENSVEHQIEIKEVYFEIPYYNYLPCDNYSYISPYSVEMINKGAIAWITTEDFFIKAGTSIEEFIKIVKEHKGKIFSEE